MSAPLATSPATLVVPAAHAVHTLELTYSLIAHFVAAAALGVAALGVAATAHVVSAPFAGSPAALVVPV